MATVFTPDYIKFFKDLAPNNNKEWFDKNRGRYENSVKIPFYSFTEELIKKIKKTDPDVQDDAKDAIFRINRDIRFSKDKTPYKMHMSAVISAEGKKHENSTGFYFELSPEAVRIYQGAYMLEPKLLNKLRGYIAKNLKEFNKLISNKKFIEHYGEIVPDEQSRIPKEFKSLAESVPLIKNKNFYFGVELDPKLIVHQDLQKVLLEYYKAGKPLCDFLDKGLGKKK